MIALLLAFLNKTIMGDERVNNHTCIFIYTSLYILYFIIMGIGILLVTKNHYSWGAYLVIGSVFCSLITRIAVNYIGIKYDDKSMNINMQYL